MSFFIPAPTRVFSRGLIACVALLVGAPSASAQGREITWTFGDAGPQATPVSTVPSEITPSAIAVGNNHGTSPLLSSTSASGGYAAASGHFNAGAVARGGKLDQGAGGSAYFEFSLIPPAGKRVEITALRFASRSTSTGPRAYAIFSSIDRFAAPIAEGDLRNNRSWALQRPALAPLTGNKGTPIMYRIYGYGGAGSASAGTVNWRIDDLVVTVAADPSSTSGPMVKNAKSTPSTPSDVRAIHEIQGTGLASPLTGKIVTVEGVVTASFQEEPKEIGGFYLQAREPDYDADPSSSEGIYVFDHGAMKTVTVSAGDVVRVTGKVTEFGTAPETVTELTNVTAVRKIGTAPLPKPIALSLPLTSATALEPYEGMLVRWPQALTVTNNFNLGHFGEFTLSKGRLLQPTNAVAPGEPARAKAAANALNQILVDDHSTRAYPDPTPFLHDSASQGMTLRAGDTVTDLTGVLSFRFGAFRLDPTIPPSATSANPRAPQAPVVKGRLRVAFTNVLNFFNGLDPTAGTGFPTARGADSLAEYTRQRAKIVYGLLGLRADLLGLSEVENDGFGPGSAVRDLVVALNAAAPKGWTYAWVDASSVDNGTDQIHSALIYRVETVAPVGSPATLSNPYFRGIARPPLAQTFRERATEEVLTVCINHFRARATVANGAGATDNISPNPNLDKNDGQGANNYVRTREATTLAAWLKSDPTSSHDPDVLVLGDLNAYAKEDPLTVLEGAGFVNLAERFEGEGGYSYAFAGQFGHLDHALASPSLHRQVVDTLTWHVNADEPAYLDYNLENKSIAQQALNADAPYRYSDHDPVVVGLDLKSR